MFCFQRILQLEEYLEELRVKIGLKLKKLMESLDIPEGMSVILRTSSLDSSEDSIKWDIDYLIQIYESVLETSVQQDAPFLIYQESSMMARLIRDYCDETVDEVFIDDKNFYDNFINAKKTFSTTS